MISLASKIEESRAIPGSQVSMVHCVRCRELGKRIGMSELARESRQRKAEEKCKVRTQQKNLP